jgi:hypothetical protein
MNGKSKGSSAERRIARFLTKWLTGQDKELYFWRSPGSGAVASINLGNKAISGDIMALKPEASFFTDIFSVEIKDGYAGADIFQHLKGGKSFVLNSFWKQCVRDAYDNDKLPLLFFRKKGGVFTASLDTSGRKLIIDKCTQLPSVTIIFEDNLLPPLYMFNKINLFNCIKPEDIKNEI